VRTWDADVEGAANYGLFADWFKQLQLAAEQQGGPALREQLTRDMLNGAEDYLRTWERAVYGGGDCVLDGSTLQVDDLHALAGAEVDRFLDAAGQPADREGAAYVYCATDESGQTRTVEVTFDEQGRAGEPLTSEVQREPVPAPGHDRGDALAADGTVTAAGETLAATGGGSALVALGLVGLGVTALRRRD
jgi:hypothetical protein